MENELINRRMIQWFPGHMTKTLRQMEKEIRNVDCVLQLLDARIPLSSLNPEIERITASKPHLYLLNKADLADPALTKQWIAYFKSAGAGCMEISSKQQGSRGAVKGMIEKELSELLARRASKGMAGARIRVMVVGIPNVGKSTFINSFAGRACAKTGNKPGVTKGKQWIRLNKGVELLDTPGILWPKFEDQQVGMRLAFVGSIKDDILNMEELALELIEYLRTNYRGLLAGRYQISEEGTAVSVLEEIARVRGCLKKGEELDYAKASTLLFDEFRSGKIGHITLEWVPAEEKE